MAWRYYCLKCGKILNRLQVSYGTDGIYLGWYRCKQCGEIVTPLKEALEIGLKRAMEGERE